MVMGQMPILIMHSPSAIAPSRSNYWYHQTVKNIYAWRFKSILTNWSGELTARPARKLFTEAGIPTIEHQESSPVVIHARSVPTQPTSAYGGITTAEKLRQ